MTVDQGDDPRDTDQGAFDCPDENCTEGFDSSQALLTHVIENHDASDIDDLTP